MTPQDSNTTISITTGTIVKAILIVLGFWVLWMLHDLVIVILAAIVLASAIEPAIRFFGRYHIPRIPSVIGVYVGLVMFVIGIFYVFIPPLLGEIADFSTRLPGAAKELNLTLFTSNEVVLQKGDELISQVADGSATRNIITTITNLSSSSTDITATAVKIFGGLLSLILVIVLSFYFAAQENGIQNFLRTVIPGSKEDYVISLWERSRRKIGKWMQGQLLLAVLVFVLVYLGLTIFGVPYALLLAFLAGMMELIPVFGPIIASIPAIAIAFLSGGTTLALIIAGFYILVQQFESNLIYPLIVRKVVGVPPVLVILSLIIGFQLGGILGALIAVPLAAAIVELFDDFEKKKGKLA